MCFSAQGGEVERAVILIGVKKTGNLPVLQAVDSGLRRMAEWARFQRIPDERVRILSDESGEVRVHQIGDEIEKLANLTTIEQLIVYFSGHGVNNRGEYWLLSRAPANANEAVNVEASVLLARYSGIPHVVMISDACRSAADGIQAQHVMGSDIFPNDPAGGLENPVDIFFACARGNPALEVRSPEEAAGQFSALYTEVLAECLRGEHAEVIEYVHEDEVNVGLVRPRKLRDHLREEVSRRLALKLGAAPRINQTPDARIVSDNTWLSRIKPTRGALRSAQQTYSEPGPSPANSSFALSGSLFSSALDGRLDVWHHALASGHGGVKEASILANAAAAYATDSGSMGFETKCGFTLRGARVARVVCMQVKAEILDRDGTIVRVDSAPRSGAPVLLVLTDGSGILVPAISEFVAELSFQGGLLTNLSYEPSVHTSRWSDYARRRDELRALRATVAASVAMGVFRLDGNEALKLASKMQYSKGVDPSMALYAAYAYHDLQRRDLINRMHSFLQDDLGFAFYDVALLAGGGPQAVLRGPQVAPACPMLSQGWTLLSAYRISLPPVLSDLEQHLLPALWTSFDAAGTAKLARRIETGEIR